MTFIQTVLLYGCTAVCALYLIAGGYEPFGLIFVKRLTRLLRQKQRQQKKPEKSNVPHAAHLDCSYLFTGFLSIRRDDTGSAR